MSKIPKPFKSPYPLVEVIWDDAYSHARTWVPVDEIEGEAEQVITVGFLIKETPKTIVLAGSVPGDVKDDEEKTVGNTMIIPRGMVITMRRVKLITMTARKSRAKKKVSVPMAIPTQP